VTSVAPVAAPSVAHSLGADPFGRCNYVSADEVSGYATAAARCRDALAAAGVDVTWTPMRPAARPAALPHRPARLPPGPFDTVVTHMVPEYFGTVRHLWPAGLHVGHTVWETDRLPTHWPALLEGPDLLVVPCRWNADTITTAGVQTPVAVVPHVAPSVRHVEGPTWAGVDDRTFVFYSVGQWTERKAVDLTVRAYLEAFTREDPVLLVVKTSWRDCTYSGPAPRGRAGPGTAAGALARLLAEWGGQDAPTVRLVTRDLTDDEMAALHARGNCYVSLCRSEGWGLGAFDAAAYGNPVVMTGFGGQLDYLDPTASWLVEHDLVPVDAPALRPSYTPDQRWAAPSVEHGSAQLREVFESGAAARARAAPLAGTIAARCSPTAVAATFAAALASAR